ncbi:MAG: hypothetical protein C0173_00550, partial [Desulfurella sp.]|uniref:type IIG restriction enzyme/methyltransferase n=1 Tax=Desulfurella sp. TaxID=1962857 RepID=UPI000CA912A4
LIEFFKKEKILEQDIDKIDDVLEKYKNIIKAADENRSESNLRQDIVNFLLILYNRDNIIVEDQRLDISIKDDQGILRAFIEVKRPQNVIEMVRPDDINKKALHQIIENYIENYTENGNFDINYFVITNGLEWFILNDSTLFNNFISNKDFQRFTNGGNNSLFQELYKNKSKAEKYELIGKFIEHYNIKLDFFYLNLKNKQYPDEIKAKALYYLLNRKTLFKEGWIIPNNLDKNFYNELLYIFGLKEEDAGTGSVKKIIVPNGVNNTIYDLIRKTGNLPKTNQIDEEILEIIILWFNRILFLKLFESQLVSFNDDQSMKFLNTDRINEFNRLNHLFFNILAKKLNDRETNDFNFIPYLNSSLFEKQEIETKYPISDMLNDPLPYYEKTILLDHNKKRREGTVRILDYLFKFLDAYDFGSEKGQSNKTFISPAVLGLVFEKINGYKDGSVYTPSEITDYMAKVTLENYIVSEV